MNSGPLTNKTLLAAQGYFELGMLEDAMAELDSLPAAMQGTSDVLQMRLFGFMRVRRWDDALEISRNLVRMLPKETIGYIHAAFCLHELRRTAEAKSLLLAGPSALLNEATYHYKPRLLRCRPGQHRGGAGASAGQFPAGQEVP